MTDAAQLGQKLALTLVASRREAGTRGLPQLASLAFSGGAGALQLREKDIPDREFYQEALELAALCRQEGRLFIINDRPDIALAVGADGVHLGQSDLPPAAVAGILPKNKIMGVSVQTVEAARAALAAGADYLGVGAVFPTGSKDDASVIKAAEIEKILALGAPTVAIGGLTVANAPEVWAMGFTGLAVISALTGADAPQEAAARLLKR